MTCVKKNAAMTCGDPVAMISTNWRPALDKGLTDAFSREF